MFMIFLAVFMSCEILPVIGYIVPLFEYYSIAELYHNVFSYFGVYCIFEILSVQGHCGEDSDA